MFEVIVIFLLLLPLYLQVRQLRKKQDESAKHFDNKMHAVYDAVNQQRRTLERILPSVTPQPGETIGTSVPERPPQQRSPAADSLANVYVTPDLMAGRQPSAAASLPVVPSATTQQPAGEVPVD